MHQLPTESTKQVSSKLKVAKPLNVQSPVSPTVSVKPATRPEVSSKKLLLSPDQESNMHVFRAERINDDTKIVSDEQDYTVTNLETEAQIAELLRERQAAQIARQIQESHPLPPLKQVFKSYGTGSESRIEAVKTKSKSRIERMISRTKIGRGALLKIKSAASPETQAFVRSFREEYIDAAAIAGSIFVSIVLIGISNFV